MRYSEQFMEHIEYAFHGDCYAVGVILSLIYVALRVLKWRGKGFLCLLSKTVFYCVTEKQRTDH